MRSIHLFTPLMGQHFYSTVFLMAFLRRMIQIWSGNATSKVVYVAYNSMSWAKLEYMQSGNPKAIYSMPNFACNLVKKCWKKLQREGVARITSVNVAHWPLQKTSHNNPSVCESNNFLHGKQQTVNHAELLGINLFQNARGNCAHKNENDD